MLWARIVGVFARAQRRRAFLFSCRISRSAIIIIAGRSVYDLGAHGQRAALRPNCPPTVSAALDPVHETSVMCSDAVSSVDYSLPVIAPQLNGSRDEVLLRQV